METRHTEILRDSLVKWLEQSDKKIHFDRLTQLKFTGSTEKMFPKGIEDVIDFLYDNNLKEKVKEIAKQFKSSSSILSLKKPTEEQVKNYRGTLGWQIQSKREILDQNKLLYHSEWESTLATLTSLDEQMEEIRYSLNNIDTEHQRQLSQNNRLSQIQALKAGILDL